MTDDNRHITVPPEIVLSPASTEVEVNEGVRLSLTCAATGQPLPRVAWSRTDGKPILGTTHGEYLPLRANKVVTAVRKSVCFFKNRFVKKNHKIIQWYFIS